MIIKFFSALSMAAILSGCNSVGNALTSIDSALYDVQRV